MLSKIVATSLLAGSMLAPASAQAPIILEGAWPDGTSLQWLCPPGKEFTFPFRFTLPSGATYDGILSCGKEV